jgi:hypothetical protein
MFVTLLRGGVHLILANPPWRQLQERAQKIQGDKKHIEGIFSQVVAARSSEQHTIAPFLGTWHRPYQPSFPQQMHRSVH